jgi:glycosyltransferase involved in cell wall biosynthesis
MCTYNGERFIKEQLNSIVEQSYKNFELIICDDGSKDATIAIIKEFQKSYPNIKLYQNETNLGFLKNFEQAIAKCSGEYIALTDQDDIWKRNKLETFLAEIGKNVLIYSDAIIIDENSQETGAHLIVPKNELCDGACNKAFLLNNFISGNTLMFKSELTQHILPIPPQMSYHDIWIGFVASTYSTICYTKEPLTYYRKYSGQVTDKQKPKPKNFFEKLKQKKDLQLEVADIRKKDLQAFSSLKILGNDATREIVEALLEHYKNYEQCFFNFKLYKLLKKYTQEVFASNRPSKRPRRAFRTAVGLKLRVASLFFI